MKDEQGTFTGYFNYYLKDDPKHIKMYNFRGISQEQVDKLEKQFRGPKYLYMGSMIIENQ